MSSIKKLKKNINNQIGEFIEEIYNWELLNPDKDLSKSEKLIDDSIKVFDLLIAKINSRIYWGLCKPSKHKRFS